ncbi:hypothetical protein [Streptomyces spongiae]|uniref:hypothetical protein n=1 Tax=Streptomyces spongiae TaxID=565072 RepID=UPI001D13DC0A|nr:hypothetical protein [Streptomyces spongiae]
MSAPGPGRPRTAGTIALFVAAALLAALGAALLVTPADPSPSDGAIAAPSTTNRPTPAPEEGPGRPQPSATAPSSASPTPSTTSTETLPREAVDVARNFTIAWASHDARRDTAFSDAGGRAAAYASGDLATDLRETSTRSAHQWQEWKATGTRVTAKVTHVALPDGAPPPSNGLAYARVFYDLVVAPEKGAAQHSTEQLALELRQDSSGWRVTALPNA